MGRRSLNLMLSAGPWQARCTRDVVDLANRAVSIILHMSIFYRHQ